MPKPIPATGLSWTISRYMWIMEIRSLPRIPWGEKREAYSGLAEKTTTKVPRAGQYHNQPPAVTEKQNDHAHGERNDAAPRLREQCRRQNRNQGRTEKDAGAGPLFLEQHVEREDGGKDRGEAHVVGRHLEEAVLLAVPRRSEKAWPRTG